VESSIYAGPKPNLYIPWRLGFPHALTVFVSLIGCLHTVPEPVHVDKAFLHSLACMCEEVKHERLNRCRPVQASRRGCQQPVKPIVLTKGSLDGMFPIGNRSSHTR
jgi:hypothetical protein